jgi:hypothetical protein
MLLLPFTIDGSSDSRERAPGTLPNLVIGAASRARLVGAAPSGPRPTSSSGAVLPEARLQLRVAGQALVLSFEDGFRLAAVAMALGILAGLVMKRPKAGVVVSGAH